MTRILTITAAMLLGTILPATTADDARQPVTMPTPMQEMAVNNDLPRAHGALGESQYWVTCHALQTQMI